MALSRVLVVGEDPHVLRTFVRILGGSSELTLAHGPRQALEFLRSERFDIVVADLHLPEPKLEILRAIQRYAPDAEVILMAGDPPGARDPEYSGCAYPRLTKPLEPVLAERTVKHAIERHRLRAEVEQLRRELEAAGIGRQR